MASLLIDKTSGSAVDETKFTPSTSVWSEIKTWHYRCESVLKIVQRFMAGKQTTKKKLTVLDLGCGKAWIKSRLPTDRVYYIGVDVFKHTKNTTILCDFNAGQYPLSVKPDIVLAIGLYHYIYDKALFLRVLRSYNAPDVFSYHFNQLSRRNTWVCPLTKNQFQQLCAIVGFKIKFEKRWKHRHAHGTTQSLETLMTLRPC